MHFPIALFLLQASKQLVSLSPVDIVIIALYFLMVLGIGYYLKNFTKTGEDFFLAGRDMTAWIAGLASWPPTSALWNSWAGPAPPINTAFSPLTGIGSAPSPPCSSWPL